jgi:hypothetical protein
MSDASKKRLLWAGVIALVAVVIAVIIVVAARQGSGAEPAGDQVKLELRAKPFADIRMNGNHVGRTPMTLVVERAATPIELEATFRTEKYRMRDMTKFVEVLKETRIVVPDDNQSVDFDVKDARPTSPNWPPDRLTE